MATSTRTTGTQLQDGTNLAGQDLDTAMQGVGAYTPIRQRGRVPHRFVRTYFNPIIGLRPESGPWMPAHNYAVANLQTPTDFYNEYRFHGYRVDNMDPTTTVETEVQWAVSSKLIFDKPAEVTRFAVTFATDSERTASFLFGLGAIGFPGTWVDNVVLSVEIQDPFAFDPGSARYQTPSLVKRDFRLGAWYLAPAGAGPTNNTLPSWPPNGPPSMATGVCIDLTTPISIPAGSRVTFSVLIPSRANLGFAPFPYTSVDLTTLIEWSTECQ